MTDLHFFVSINGKEIKQAVDISIIKAELAKDTTLNVDVVQTTEEINIRVYEQAYFIYFTSKIQIEHFEAIRASLVVEWTKKTKGKYIMFILYL